MFNWKKLCSNENSFEELHEELMTGNGSYILDNVMMPETCSECVCSVEFRYYSESRIVLLCSDAPVGYLGGNTQISEWLATGRKEFGSFDEVKTFLSKFKTDRLITSPENEEVPVTVVEEGEHPEPKKPRPKLEYDKDKLTVPDSKKKYVVIDKDKLILDLNEEIFGQSENIEKIAHLVCNHLATKHRSRPLSVFIYGSTGIGKSAVIKALVSAINKQIGNEKAYAYRPVDCTQFQERADISRLTGAAPGYVGFEEPGVFAILENNPNTVFVFEEIEKAANNVTEVIMQAMETGKQETNGKTLRNGESYYDLSNCIIFFTSNIEVKEKKSIGFASPVERTREESKANPSDSTNIARLIGTETREAKIKLAETGKFRREVIGRMNAIIKFDAITGDAIKDISAKCIADLAEKDHYLYVAKIDHEILQEFLDVTAGEVENFGVRALRDEAQYYFSDAFRTFSHSHEDYTCVRVSGTLDNIILEEM